MKSLKYTVSVLGASSLMLMGGMACHNQGEDSQLSVTQVKHTEVKQQSIGNCWLYAMASWMESLKLNQEEELNVSETYWTYWDWYIKLKRGGGADEISTGGTWRMAVNIINQYGWVSEEEFVSSEGDQIYSSRQKCAEDRINRELKEGGRLFEVERDHDTLISVLNDAFTCNDEIKVDGEAVYQTLAKSSNDTQLVLPGSENVMSMRLMMRSWRTVQNPYRYSPNSAKKLPSTRTMASFKSMEQRIKKALNDHMPVVLGLYVSFNAVDAEGKFNLNSLAKKGSLGSGGGHMIVMHDYTVSNVPELDYLGEGDMDPELKEAALLGDLDYIVSKNSWGANRLDRPWIKNGYSRVDWDYLTKAYVDDEGDFRSFMYDIVLPPGY